ncbi:NAD(P)H-dependent FMN reductase LOT6 [Hyphodiscus hymeniophilus]|uniref:NAD(P)H-dependent FMN reductase LOT6 n=1 Tax=Hyphodiscus hymeniophilus TaxID=353542 RepID=A0A9P6VSS5_9HELO|nr:NAD(P)H-dependent FMN reductase LOT6 [Hyphodiscus hymeniophilus]
MAQKTIALVICSIRSPRVGPSIANWLTSLITPRLSSTPHIKLTTLDLADFPMPLSPSGRTIPAKLPVPLSTSPYSDPEVNTFSLAIRQIDAFIFLTPQYNWSIPGVVKVAFDHLFHEWKGKPMMVVSYGGHGGGKGAVHLKEVWKGLRGGECVAGVELALGGGVGKAVEGVLDEGVRQTWEAAAKGDEISEGWGKLVRAFEEEKS